MHRPGHIDGSGDGNQSMDRRKYLNTLAAGAAFGTIAVGLAACGGGSGSTQESLTAPADTTHTDDHGPTGNCAVTKQQFGYLSIFPEHITTIEMAQRQENMPKTTDSLIRVPYFNS